MTAVVVCGTVTMSDAAGHIAPIVLVHAYRLQLAVAVRPASSTTP